MSEGAGLDPKAADAPTAEPADGAAQDQDGVIQEPRTRVGFRSAKAPSWPFLIALLLGILGAIVFALSASALFVFGVGVAIAFFLVPVVNWLERRGLARWVSAILAVVVTLIVLISIIGIVALIIIDQGIELWTARMKTRVRETIGRIDDLESGPLYPTVRAALAAFEAREEVVEPEGASNEQPAPDDGA